MNKLQEIPYIDITVAIAIAFVLFSIGFIARKREQKGIFKCENKKRYKD